MGNVVDTLEIEIQASAKEAVNGLTQLENKLKSIAASSRNLAGAANQIRTLTTTLSGLGKINTTGLDNTINQLRKIDRFSFTGTADLANMAKSLRGLAAVDVSNTSIVPFIKEIKKLSSVKLDPDTAQNLTAIVNSMNGLAQIQDVSDNVTKMISALTRLAKTSGSIKTVSAELPNFAAKIRNVATTLSQLGGVDPQVTSFVRAIGTLANAGKKMPLAAQNLGVLTNAVVQMVNSLKGVNINSDVTRLVEAIAQLSSSLSHVSGNTGRQVSTNLNTVGKAFKSLYSIVKKLGKIVVDVFKKIGSVVGSAAKSIIMNVSGMKAATNSMFTVSDGIKSIIGGLLGMRGITGVFNWAREAVTAGGDITEIDHIVKSVFGEHMVGYVNDWANNAISKFGIAAGAAKHYAGVLSSMFQASEIGADSAGHMAMQMVELAGDLSAFYNVDTETSYEKVKSGLAGMVRPLRDLGIDLSVATLQQYALSQGITKSVSAMTQAEKVMLRYNYLLSVTSTQQGDFQRTADSYANSLRTLKALTQSVSTQIGVGLAAALRHVIIFLRETMRYVLKLAQAFATFMQTLFGKYEGGASGIAMEGLGDASDYAEDLDDSANGAASGLGDASDAAEKLKKDLSVLPFDELNQLNKDKETSSSLSGLGDAAKDLGGLGDLGDLGDALLDMEGLIDGSDIPEAISKWAERIRNAFLAHNWFALGRDIAGLLNQGLEKIYELLDPEAVREKVEPFITGFAATFNSFVDHLNFDLIGSIIGRGLTDIAMLFNIWYDNMNLEHLGEQLSEAVNGFFADVDFVEIGNALGNKFMMAWDIFLGFVSNPEMWVNLGNALADGILGLNEKIRAGDIAHALATFINGIASALVEFTRNAPWNEVVNNIVNGITTFIRDFKWRANGEALGLFINRLFITLRDFLGDLPWSEFGTKLAQFLMSAIHNINFGNIGQALSNFVHGMFEMLKAFLAEMNWLEVGMKIGELIKGIEWGRIITDIIETAFVAAAGLQHVLWGLLYETIVKPIKEYFDEKIQEWKDLGLSVISGFFLGIGEAVADIATWIYNTIFKPFIEGFCQAFKIGSPSKVMDGYGGDVMEGFKNGLVAGLDAIKEFVIGIPEKFMEWLGDPFTWLFSPGSEIIKHLAGGMGSEEDKPEGVISKIQSFIFSVFSQTETKADQSGRDTITTYGNGYQNTAALCNALGMASSLVQNQLLNIQNAVGTIGSNTVSGYGRAFSNQAELSNNLSNTQSLTSTAFTAIQKAAESIGNNTKKGVLHGLTTHLTGLEDTTGRMMSQVQTTRNNIEQTMNIDLSGSGRYAAQSFASGFQGVHIPTPHIYTAAWDTWYFGDGGYTSIPRFAVQWYKAGGLFNGGKGQIIGVGEDNKDEAVLPLENRRAMSRIADSIVNASSGSGLGISKDDIVEGVVQAMLMTQNQQGDPIFHVEVKTENDEVLARAVTRGQRSIDYRNNPTPQLAY